MQACQKSNQESIRRKLFARHPWPPGAASTVFAAAAAAAAAGDPCATATVMTLPPKEEDEPWFCACALRSLGDRLVGVVPPAESSPALLCRFCLLCAAIPAAKLARRDTLIALALWRRSRGGRRWRSTTTAASPPPSPSPPSF